MTWKSTTVTLCDGTQVASDTEEWRIECEARYILALSRSDRAERFAGITQKRGTDGANRLREACHRIEPYYVLSLPNIAERRAYLANVALHFGQRAADDLRERAVNIHETRKSINATTSA